MRDAWYTSWILRLVWEILFAPYRRYLYAGVLLSGHTGLDLFSGFYPIYCELFTVNYLDFFFCTENCDFFFFISF